ncbi:bifunctional DNA-formamidopyrimidine glycosylase/DNA-(apurinic or apyrimidinic site) lyase [Alphaproteobacteria bacterium]|nr:bifunctional DNA-formamidopyrimidine glycosylase/DNA-(apurinic or apyrimidinic site) lyase [Alphaproteobacteria bacterium]
MPELPEVETTIRYLFSKVNGKKIISIQSSKKKLRKNLQSKYFSLVEGSKIETVHRIAKYIVLTLKPLRYLIIHLGMSGRLKFFNKKNYLPEKHDHVLMEFSQFFVVFNDPRRFGMFFMLDDRHELKNFFQHYGIDLLTDPINFEEVYKTFQKKNISLKQILLDQRVFVGIGNIYANEALFDSRLHPERKSNTLTKNEMKQLISSCRHVLELSLKNGGSSINDYKSPDGTLGSFQNMFQVYQRSEIIMNKKRYPVKKIVQNGRSTFFSPTLQK